MMGCKKCTTLGGILFLVAGLLFLLRDLDVWDFWNVQWWTALFLLWGLGSLGWSSCKDCQSTCSPSKKR